jgi:hypothetical protein
VNANSDARRTAGHTPAKGGRFQSITMIVIFDVAGPLALYNALRHVGMTVVPALLLSGIPPALGVAIGAIRNRRLDVIGALVLAGIAVGVVLALVTHNPKLILAEGSVPTTFFGISCLASLWARRPLMFTFALEFIGPDTAQGQEMTRLWRQYEGYRRVFRVITAVWGVGFLIEAALRIVVIYHTSTGIALGSSMITPFIFAGVLSAWTVAYGTRQRKKGERMMAAAGPAGPATGASAVSAPPSPADTTIIRRP